MIKTEEKGSDVNLGIHMLNDGYKKDYELAVMMTNDSDLLEPMRIVKQELGLPVGLVNPHRTPSFSLRQHANFIKQVRSGVLGASQFPASMTDQNGTFQKTGELVESKTILLFYLRHSVNKDINEVQNFIGDSFNNRFSF